MKQRQTDQFSMLAASKWPPSMRYGLAVLGLFGAAVAAPEIVAATTARDNTAIQIAPPVSFAPIIDRVAPAVVNITVDVQAEPIAHNRDASPFFFHSPQPRNGQGSGFIISDDGYIVTNHHVIADAKAITVTLADGREFPATRVGSDAMTDLAVIKITADTMLPVVAFDTDDQIRVGDRVLAVGNPFGLGGSVTSGIISARGRDIGTGRRGGGYGDFIQIDAPINRGNSGGPTFNLDGEVIGVNTAIFSPGGGNVGIGFAVPAKTARIIVDQLIDTGFVERGYLGVRIQNIDTDLADALGRADAGGALIAELLADSPAARAGLQRGDAILALDGSAITDATDLSRRIAQLNPDTPAMLTIARNGETTDIEIILGALPDENSERQAQTDVLDNPTQKRYGLTLAPLNAAARQRYDLDAEAIGVVITAVKRSSAAAAAGLRAGDLILEINGKAMINPQDAVAELRADKDRALVLTLTARGTRYVALKAQV